ncbi:MAG: hypothetical protein ACK4F9_03790 [Brevinematia bacterium]
MNRYVGLRIFIFFVIIITVLIIFSYVTSEIQDTNKFISFLKIFLFEVPVAASSSIAIVYTFFFTENRLAALPSKNLTSAFTPSILFTISIVLIIILLQEITLPYLTKQKLTNEGVKDVIFGIDKNKYLFVHEVKLDKKNNIYILSNGKLLQKNTHSIIKNYNILKYDPSKNVLIAEGKSIELNGNLEKVLMFFVDRNYFFGIWEFNNVKDSFVVFDIKTSFLNFIMYEKIFIPVISFVMMVFCITIGWRWRMNRESKLMPLYITIGAVMITVAIKMIYYLSVRIFEFMVFPF